MTLEVLHQQFSRVYSCGFIAMHTADKGKDRPAAAKGVYVKAAER